MDSCWLNWLSEVLDKDQVCSRSCKVVCQLFFCPNLTCLPTSLLPLLVFLCSIQTDRWLKLGFEPMCNISEPLLDRINIQFVLPDCSESELDLWLSGMLYGVLHIKLLILSPCWHSFISVSKWTHLKINCSLVLFLSLTALLWLHIHIMYRLCKLHIHHILHFLLLWSPLLWRSCTGVITVDSAPH